MSYPPPLLPPRLKGQSTLSGAPYSAKYAPGNDFTGAAYPFFLSPEGKVETAVILVADQIAFLGGMSFGFTRGLPVGSVKSFSRGRSTQARWT